MPPTIAKRGLRSCLAFDDEGAVLHAGPDGTAPVAARFPPTRDGWDAACAAFEAAETAAPPFAPPSFSPRAPRAPAPAPSVAAEFRPAEADGAPARLGGRLPRPARRLAIWGGALVVVVAALAWTLSAGGGPAPGSASGPPPAEPAAKVLASARAALASAQSFVVKGTAPSLPGGLAGALSGTAWRDGDLDLVLKRSGGTATLLVVAGKLWVRASPAYLAASGVSARAAEADAGRWLAATGREASAYAAGAEVAAIVAYALARPGRLSERPRSLLAGRPAVELVSSAGWDLWVAASGKPWPLRLSGKMRYDGRTVTLGFSLSSFGARPLPRAPAGA